MKNNQKQPKVDMDALYSYEATHYIGALHREWATEAQLAGKSFCQARFAKQRIKGKPKDDR